MCDYYIDEPKKMQGRWAQAFRTSRPVWLEVGCGKGVFAGQLAMQNPDVNIIAADIKADMLGVARRTIEKLYEAEGKTHDNLLLVLMNVAELSESFSEEDRVDRIYINFCNPWNRGKHNKRRLTHPRQLTQYKKILSPGGEIHFKTDDDILFEESLDYFSEEGFEPFFLTRDLHSEDVPNIMTEHEKMFSEEGIKIKAAYFRLKG